MSDGRSNGQNETRRNKTEGDITAEVLARFSGTPDPRLRQIMLSLISHLHAFVKEVQLTEAEWFQAIEILTEAGKMCSDKRQEFILLSDTLGVSMVVDLINHVVHRPVHCFVMLNLYPYNSGHLMVAPYQHTGDFAEIMPQVGADVLATAQLATRVLAEAVHPDGFNAIPHSASSSSASIPAHQPGCELVSVPAMSSIISGH